MVYLLYKNGDFPWLYGYMLNNQRVLHTQYTYVYMKENSHGHWSRIEHLWRDNDGHCCRPQHVLCSKSSFWNRWVNKQTLNFEELRSKIPTSNILVVGFFLQKHTENHTALFGLFSVGGVAELPQVGRGSHRRVQPLGSPRMSGAEPGGVEALPLGPQCCEGPLGPPGTPETAGRSDDFGCHAKVGQALVPLDILFKLSIIHSGTIMELLCSFWHVLTSDWKKTTWIY